jgi:hypothetical protein
MASRLVTLFPMTQQPWVAVFDMLSCFKAEQHGQQQTVASLHEERMRTIQGFTTEPVASLHETGTLAWTKTLHS